jgi:hypothetical protein
MDLRTTKMQMAAQVLAGLLASQPADKEKEVDPALVRLALDYVDEVIVETRG